MTEAHFARLGACLLAAGAICLCLFVPPASADGIEYVVTSTYSAAASSGPFSAPDTTFTLTFTEPDTLTSLDTTSIPITFTLGTGPCCTFSGLGDVVFYSAAESGLFDVVITEGGDTFIWAFYGPQAYSGSAPYTLLTDTFAIDLSPAPLSQFVDLYGLYSDNFSGGTVTATSVPEPATLPLTLLGAGFAGLVCLLRNGRAH